MTDVLDEFSYVRSYLNYCRNDLRSVSVRSCLLHLAMQDEYIKIHVCKCNAARCVCFERQGKLEQKLCPNFMHLL
jgi:hypothetical protein